MSLGTPRRMKMTLIAAPPQSSSRDALQRAGSEVVCYLVPRACRGVGPRYPHQGFSTEYQCFHNRGGAAARPRRQTRGHMHHTIRQEHTMSNHTQRGVWLRNTATTPIVQL